MRRSELLANHALRNAPSTGEGLGAIRNASPYQQRFEARLRGELVTVIGQADVVGMSPCEKIIDHRGLIDWVSSDELVVTQSDALPRSFQQMQALFNQGEQTFAPSDRTGR